MHNLIKLIVINKINSIQNINYLINTISNIQQRINNPTFHLHNLIEISHKISNPVTEFMTNKEIEAIDLLAEEFFSTDFNKKVFLQRDFSNKLQQLWNILNEIYFHDPNDLVHCVYHIVDKRIPKKLTESEKNKFIDNLLSRFTRTSRKINTVTDFIFEQVKRDKQTQTLDVLSICGILLSFVVNSQSHLYFVMQNMKKAKDILKGNYDIEQIFSLQSKVTQNTEVVTDIQAIRNAVSHGSFNIEFSQVENEYIVDFESVLSRYSFNRRYTCSELFILYGIYDNLRNFQELLVRMAFLKATLKLNFFR